MAAAPVLIRLGGNLQVCCGVPFTVCHRAPLIVDDAPMAVDMRLTGEAAVAGATAANFVGGYGLPVRDILV